MRVEPPSSLMGRKGGRRVGKEPACASIAGRILAALRGNAGRPVDISPFVAEFGSSGASTARRDLEDFYGMDIRTARSGTGRRRGSELQWLLAGEWFGLEYRDYVNDAIDEAVKGR